jgi:sulfate adenylyltransferase subunit 1 (EFTu-like GTPase family)
MNDKGKLKGKLLYYKKLVHAKQLLIKNANEEQKYYLDKIDEIEYILLNDIMESE